MTTTEPTPATEPTAATTRRRLLTTAAGGAGALAVASPMLWIPPASAAEKPAGVHLTYGADPRRSMTVSWSSPRSVRKPRLEIGTDGHLGRVVPANSRPTKDLATVYHHAEIDGLRPGTRYRYRITHQGSAPVNGSFTTAPKRPTKFRFAAFGDMGVNAAALAHVALIDTMKPDLSFVVGDLCYADSSGGTGASGPDTQDFETWNQWLQMISRNARHSPWMTTVGNHEMEGGNGELGYAGYLDRFVLPDTGVKGAPVTYSFVYGNVGFIALDGNDASFEITRNNGYLGSAQDAWLEGELKRLRATPTIDFVVVGFHNCMYCTNAVHGSDGGNRSRWEPLFDRYTVDLVVNGHNHCYERTHLMRDGSPVVDAPRGATVDSARGTTYLTAGGAGQAVYPVGGQPLSYVTIEGGTRVPEPTTYAALTDATHSIGFVDVLPRNAAGVATMKLVALDTAGNQIDRVTLTRKHRKG